MNKRGFTLIEILIALVIFAILATLTSSILYYALNTQARVTAKADQLADLQLAISLITRDTQQAIKRPIRSDDMLLFPAFEGTLSALEFTRNGFTNPGSVEKRSTLKRVAFVCQNKHLLRRSWDSLDPLNKKDFKEKSLFTHLRACQFHYINKTSQVLDEWRGNTMGGQAGNESLPKALQLSLTFNNNDKLILLFVIPVGLYA